MRPVVRWLLAGLLVGPISAQAGTLQQVREAHLLRCGAEPRPGFASDNEAGRITGRAVELCRGIALRLLGASGRMEFRLYQAPSDFEALRAGIDEVAFLTQDTLTETRLVDQIVVGPAVFEERDAIMVPVPSPVRTIAELSGQVVCLMIAGSAQRALDTVVAERHLTVARLAFEEDVEMLDAYNVGRCGAMVDTASRLTEMQQNGGINHLRSRILEESLDSFPVRAVTGRRDAAWSALVASLLAAPDVSDEHGMTKRGMTGEERR